MAVRAAVTRVATIDPAWAGIKIVARPVEISVPSMPLTDEELMKGARERALAVCEVLKKQKLDADLYVGLEGGFHSIEVDGQTHTFLRGWAYVTDGRNDQDNQVRSPSTISEAPSTVSEARDTRSVREHGYFGSSPSIAVPNSIRQAVIEGQRELGIVIDEVAGTRDVRSRQGAWGVLSRDLVTRSLSFELALIAAFAPFYNAPLYT
jgi:non-canonical (house-cleaning) NTP pyrophosphatase